jgi:copper transport protein
LAALVLAGVAQAHAFLIRSDPETGARLAASPPRLTLYFSERFVGGSERVVIRRAGAGDVGLPAPQARGRVVTQSLPPQLKGVFVVHWRVLSDDGHISLGEFAFAVGSSAPLPELKATSAKTPPSEVVASWLFFVGLSLAFGGLVSERLLWAGRKLAARHAPIIAGAVVAFLAAVAQLVLIAGARAGGGFAAGLRPTTLESALGTRPGTLTVVVIAALATAAALAVWERTRLLALPTLLFVIVATALRGHSGTSGHAWAVAADAIHLAAVALWLGALAHLVIVVAARRAEGALATLAAGARRYAGLALVTTLIVVASGVGTALAEFGNLGELTSTGYGRTLLVKAGLVAVALGIALTARLRALPANPTLRLPLLRLLTRLEATTLAAVLVAAALLVNLAPPRSSTASAAAVAPVLGPPPLEGPAVRLADLAGQLVVGMAASERELQFTIIAPGQAGAAVAKLRAEAEPAQGKSVDLYPRPCGEGCFVIRYRLTGETTITAAASVPGWTGGKVQFTVPWPLKPPADAALRRVARTMKGVPRLLLTESVTSGPGSGGRPVGYTLRGKAFMATELYGGGAVDVREISRGDGLTQLAFALPGSNIWYRIWFDARDRLRREMIISPGHLIRRSFRYGAKTATAAPPSPTPSPSSPTGGVPAPPVGSVVFGREDGDLAVGLALRSRGGGLELQATVLGPDGGGLSGLDVSYRVDTRGGTTTATARACGSGCYRAGVAATGRPERVLVRLGGGGRAASTVAFDLPRRWPPADAGALLRRATRVFRSLRTLVINERLASSPTNALFTTYQLAAPDRLTYRIKGGAEAIVIGSRRWDREPGGPWRESAQSPLRQPTPAWSAPTNAHLIGSREVGGRQAWLISFYDTRIPAFFTIAVDKATKRTLELRMTAAAHFMHHRYSRFNVPLRITPPR